ncbi:uncharacterized protein LOC128267945 [Anopheles cruzii]|uniref:uncharacterized protein LOC128267945 n=1 Tax=Anopheles cruzii TaxID=68878 RepID=UPI0022EC21BD|nr:uncharacterized protein LOC128267945 [Anopheles cruzii]
MDNQKKKRVKYAQDYTLLTDAISIKGNDTMLTEGVSHNSEPDIVGQDVPACRRMFRAFFTAEHELCVSSPLSVVESDAASTVSDDLSTGSSEEFQPTAATKKRRLEVADRQPGLVSNANSSDRLVVSTAADKKGNATLLPAVDDFSREDGAEPTAEPEEQQQDLPDGPASRFRRSGGSQKPRVKHRHVNQLVSSKRQEPKQNENQILWPSKLPFSFPLKTVVDLAAFGRAAVADKARLADFVAGFLLANGEQNHPIVRMIKKNKEKTKLIRTVMRALLDDDLVSKCVWDTPTGGKVVRWKIYEDGWWAIWCAIKVSFNYTDDFEVFKEEWRIISQSWHYCKVNSSND